MNLLIRAGNSPFAVAPSRPANLLGYGNSGNILFADAVYKSLYRPDNRIDVNLYRPDFATAAEINEKYDALVLPLANAFRPAFEDQLRQYTDLVRRLRIPCVVVGVGAQARLGAAEQADPELDRATQEFVASVLDRSATIGVRGEFTRRYLAGLGFASVDIVGCPSMFYNGPDLHVRRAKPALDVEDIIAVNHAGDIGDNVDAFIRTALTLHPNSVFVAQMASEARAWTRILARLAPHDKNRVRYFNGLPPWLALMKGCAFSVGPRMHGNIAALLAGIPALVLIHDSRTQELCDYHQIPQFPANAIAPATPIADLYDAADIQATNAAAPDRFGRYRAFLEKNGLAHGLDDPRNAAMFDARVAAMNLPAGAGA